MRIAACSPSWSEAECGESLAARKPGFRSRSSQATLAYRWRYELSISTIHVKNRSKWTAPTDNSMSHEPNAAAPPFRNRTNPVCGSELDIRTPCLRNSSLIVLSEYLIFFCDASTWSTNPAPSIKCVLCLYRRVVYNLYCRALECQLATSGAYFPIRRHCEHYMSRDEVS